MIPFRYCNFILLFFCALIIQSASAHALDIEKIRFGAHSDKTRMVVELNEQTKFSTFMLPQIEGKPYRLVVDLPDFNWQASAIKRPPNTTILDVRSGKLKPNTKRLVVDLGQPAKILKAFFLPASGKKPHRLVVDYKTITKAQFLATKRDPIGTLPSANTVPAKDTRADLTQLITRHITDKILPPPTSKVAAPTQAEAKIILPPRKPVRTTQKTNIKAKPAPAITSKPAKTKSPLYRPLIVIDAGHGGQDPGAVGAERQREKHVTLSAAKALKKNLDKTGRYRVALTRNNDRYIKLYKRVSIARDKDADLFISLHADSIGKSNVRGASIYTLSNKASDAQTAKLARRENQADLIAGVDLSHEDKDVANILIDLAMRDTMNQSKFFANTVVKHMRLNNIRILPRPHRYAGFAVLKAPDVPSVLVEMGFMSNKKEARLLMTKSYQQKIATALTNSINSYFQKLAKNNR